MGRLSAVSSMEDGSLVKNTFGVLWTGNDGARYVMFLLRASSWDISIPPLLTVWCSYDLPGVVIFMCVLPTWTVVLEVFRYDLVASAASDGSDFEFL